MEANTAGKEMYVGERLMLGKCGGYESACRKITLVTMRLDAINSHIVDVANVV